MIFYDSEAKYKAVEIRFSENEVTRVFEPGRFLELFSERAHKPIDADLLRIDSDRALEIGWRKAGLSAQADTGTDIALETGRDGMPVWKINFWRQTATRESHLGEIVLSAYDGRILKNHIRPSPQLQANASSKILLQNRF